MERVGKATGVEGGGGADHVRISSGRSGCITQVI